MKKKRGQFQQSLKQMKEAEASWGRNTHGECSYEKEKLRRKERKGKKSLKGKEIGHKNF